MVLSRAEDRATVGTDPSAVPAAKSEAAGRVNRPAALQLRVWHKRDKPIPLPSRAYGLMSGVPR